MAERHHSTCVCITCTSAREAGIMRAVTDGIPEVTLRDFFAGCALIGMMANSSIDMEPTQTAEWAYENSDAMLAARDAGEEKDE